MLHFEKLPFPSERVNNFHIHMKNKSLQSARRKIRSVASSFRETLYPLWKEPLETRAKFYL